MTPKIVLVPRRGSAFAEPTTAANETVFCVLVAPGNSAYPALMKVTFELNAREVSIDADGNMPLLWALRDLFGLTGTKYGCGRGLCGVCTVHLDGVAIRSCQVPLHTAADRTVTTIEGLSDSGTHPVQRAWQELRVPQCGYCQPGQIMTAAAFLARNPDPTADEIDAAMRGNLCRCGTYLRIRQAVAKAAQG